MSVSPLDGWPPTVKIKENGQEGFQIDAVYLTPGRASMINTVLNVIIAILRPFGRMLIFLAFFAFLGFALVGTHMGIPSFDGAVSWLFGVLDPYIEVIVFFAAAFFAGFVISRAGTLQFWLLLKCCPNKTTAPCPIEFAPW